MRDKVSFERAKKLHPQVVNEVMEIIEHVEAGWPKWCAIRIVQGLRTIEEQDELYAQGRTKPGKKVTNARGGYSFHNYGLAIDFALLFDKDGNGSFESLSWDTNDPKWMEVVNAFEDKGWFWGGKFSTIVDKPHLQKTFGFTVKQLKEMYKSGEYVKLS